MLVTKLFANRTEPDVRTFTRRIDGNVAELPALPPARKPDPSRWNGVIRVLMPVVNRAGDHAARILPKPEFERWSSRIPALPPIPMRRPG